MKEKSITIGGIIGICVVTGLVIFTSWLVLRKMNDNADSAYMSTLNAIYASQSSKSSDDPPSDSPGKQDPDPGKQDVKPDKDKTVAVDHEASKAYIISINGKTYILYDYVKDADSVDKPSDSKTDDYLVIDAEDTIIIDGRTYVRIDTDKSVVREEFTNQNGYIGLNYVCIDADGNIVYHINEGDTLSGISDKVGYSVDAIANENGIRNPDLIYKDSTIRIPVNDKLKESITQEKTTEK